MSAQDRNKVFFGLVHYILSEQSNVDWIFKTSIINYVGAKQTVGDGGSANSNLNDLIDFIYDMKPFHTQFSEFLQSMEIESEVVNVNVEETTDFDETIRFDNVWSEPNKDLQDIVDQGGTPDRSWLSTTMADRLFVAGMRDLKELKYELRADFKGKILNGGSSANDKIGYDILMYDEDRYDGNSIIYDYCIRDFNEDFSGEDTAADFSYTKEFPAVGTTNFVFESDEGVDKSNLKCTLYRKITGKTTELTDYSIVKSGNYQFTLFQGLNEDDKLIIRVMDYQNKVKQAFVYVGSTFIELNGDNIKRTVIPLVDEIRVAEPESNIASKKLFVVKQLQSGTRIPFLNYTKDNGYVVTANFADKEHIVLSAFDYQFLYDVTLSYTDPKARSNNTVIYTGGNFLRPDYEADRPEDLCVGHFSENTAMYLSDGSKSQLDFKDLNTHYLVAKTAPQKITNVVAGSNGYVAAFTVEDVREYPTGTPFIVQVGEELIKVNKVGGNTFANLIRGYNGTPLHSNSETGSDIAVGDMVYMIPEIGAVEYEAQNRTISYYVNKWSNKIFNAPIGTEDTDTIEVSRLVVGTGVPEILIQNQYQIISDNISKFGKLTTDPVYPNASLIVGDNQQILYVIRGKSVSDAQGKEVGVYRRKAIIDFAGKQIGKVNTDNEFVTSIVKIVPLIPLNVGDVIHISTIKS